MTDEQLVENFKNGHNDAFDELVRRYQQIIFNVAYRFLGNRQDVLDAAQDVFVKVYYALPDFEPNAKFSTWLYRITVNHCLNVLRSKKRRRWLSTFSNYDKDSQNQFFNISDDTHNPESNFEKSEKEEIIRKAIDSLSAPQRAAVILHRYQGLTYKEIAQVMNTSVSSVESSLHRAKKKLGQYLSRYADEF